MFHSSSGNLNSLVTQVWLNRSVVGHIPGCLAELWHAVTFCWGSPGIFPLRQKGKTLS